MQTNGNGFQKLLGIFTSPTQLRESWKSLGAEKPEVHAEERTGGHRIQQHVPQGSPRSRNLGRKAAYMATSLEMLSGVFLPVRAGAGVGGRRKGKGSGGERDCIRDNTAFKCVCDKWSTTENIG